MTRLQRAIARIVAGAEHLARACVERATAWIQKGRRDDLTGWQATLGSWVRVAWLALLIYILWRTMRAIPALMWLLTAAIAYAAWRAGGPRKPAPAAAAQEAPEPVEETPVVTVSAAELVDLLCRCIGPRSGVHLAVLPRLLGQLTGHPWTTASVRAACEAHGVPIDRGVRMPGRNPSTGVRLAALPNPSQTPPVAGVGGVVVAGQESATPPATATATPGRLQVGEGDFDLVDDAANPVRTRVLWRTRKGVNGE